MAGFDRDSFETSAFSVNSRVDWLDGTVDPFFAIWGTVAVESTTFGHNALSLRAASGTNEGRAIASTNKVTGTWKYRFKFEGTSSRAGMFVPFAMSYAASSAPKLGYGLSFHSDGTFKLYKYDSAGTGTAIITSTWTIDTSIHTVQINRDSSGNWEIFLDGVSKGTVTDTTYSTACITALNIWSGTGSPYLIVDYVEFDDLASPLLTLPSGSGTSGSPYLISTLDQLELMPSMSLSAYYKLTANIDASSTGNAGYNNSNGFVSIPGTFTGDFNGDNYTITGLTINRASSDGVSFFYAVNGQVHHITFDSVSITGRDYVGTVAAYADQGSGQYKFHNITITGTITGRGVVGGLIGQHTNGGASYISVTATVTGTGTSIGGVCGYHVANGSNIYDHCTYSGSLTGTGNTGGIVGNANCVSVTNSSSAGDIYYTGDTTGGICGYLNNNFNVDGCSTTMVFHKGVGTTNNVGGIVGYAVNGNVMNCTVTTGTITGSDQVGGLIGYKNGGNGNCTNNQVTANITGANNVAGMYGYWGQANSGGGSLNNSTYTGTITGTANYIGGIVGRTNNYPNINNIDVTSSTVISASATSDGVGGAVGGGYSLNISYVDVSIDVTGRNSVGGIVGAGDVYNYNISHCNYDGDLVATGYCGGIIGSTGDGNPRLIEYCTSSGTITITASYAGGIAGTTNCNVDNCISSMVINVGSSEVGGIVGATSKATLAITNCSFTGTIHAVSQVGGIVGRMDSTGTRGAITNCDVTTSEIHTTGNNIGGIVGYGLNYDISLCDVNAVITGVSNVGGIGGQFGYSGVTIQTSTVIGSITGSGSGIGGVLGQVRYGTTIIGFTLSSATLSITAGASSDQVGGIVGKDNEESADAAITSCTVSMNITGRDYVGGICGYQRRVTFTNCTYTGTVSGRSYIGGIAGLWGYISAFSFGTGNTANGTVTGTGERIGGLVGSTPYGGTIPTGNTNNATVTGSASSDYVAGIIGYQCHNSYDLNITSVVNNGNVTGRDGVGGTVGTYSRGTITSPTNTGTVSGRTDVGGILGQCNGCMAVGNTISVTTITHKMDVTGTGDDVGGIVGGRTSATNAILKIEKCRYKGTVQGANYVGGIVGRHHFYYSGSTISQCFSQGTVTATTSYAGGITGYHHNAPITNCFSISTVSATTSYAGGLIGYYNANTGSYCYSMGSVSTPSNAGGLVGAKNTATMTSGYWDTETSGKSSSALGTGKTTSEMKTEGTYTSWDFATPIWLIGCPNYGYPYLQNANLFDSFTCPSAITSTETIGTAKINLTIIIDDITSSESFGSLTVTEGTSAQNLLPGSITSSESVGSLQVNLQLLIDAIDSLETIGTAKLNLTAIISAITSSESVSSPLIRYLTTIVASSITSSEDLGQAKLNLQLILDAIDSLEAFGTDKINLQLIAEGITSAESVNEALIKIITLLLPSSIASSESVSQPKLNLQLLAESIASSESLGLDQINLILKANGIASAETVTEALLKAVTLLLPSSITSSESVSGPQVNLRAIVESIDSEEDVNAPIVKAITTILASAIASTESLGTSKVNMRLLFQAIESSETLGDLQTNLRIYGESIASSETVGDLVIKHLIRIIASSISSGESLGTLKTNLRAIVSSIDSAEIIGDGQLNLRMVISAITSSENFGVNKINFKLLCASVDSEEDFGVIDLLGITRVEAQTLSSEALLTAGFLELINVEQLSATTTLMDAVIATCVPASMLEASAELDDAPVTIYGTISIVVEAPETIATLTDAWMYSDATVVSGVQFVARAKFIQKRNYAILDSQIDELIDVFKHHDYL